MHGSYDLHSSIFLLEIKMCHICTCAQGCIYISLYLGVHVCVYLWGKNELELTWHFNGLIFIYSCSIFETGSHQVVQTDLEHAYGAQAGLEITEILQPQPPSAGSKVCTITPGHSNGFKKRF